MILALLTERPRGGYELLRELEHRYGPTYRPSPGSNYPALTALRAELLVQPLDEGRRPAYTPTAAGLQMLTDQQHVLARVAMRTNKTVDDEQFLQPILAQFTDRVSRTGARADRAAVERILDNAAKMIADLDSPHGK